MPQPRAIFSGRPSRRAFTLIELLTVIAIIGILAAIIIPTVGKVRETARSSVCASNLRQISAACLLYASENKNRLVPMKETSTGRYWRVLIEPYIGSRKSGQNILVCPADSVVDYPSSSNTGEWPASYGLNYSAQYLSGNKLYEYDGNPASRPLSAIKEPSRMIMVTDISKGSGSLPSSPSQWTDNRTATSASYGYARMPWSGSFDSDWSVWPRHGAKNKANASFFDGSVRALDLIADLKDHPAGDPLCLFDNH